MAQHATVKVGEYTVPLIGVAPDATQEECAVCKGSFHLTEIALDDEGRPCCNNCITKKETTP